MENPIPYTWTRRALWTIAIGALLSSYLFVWKDAGKQPVNFLDGDPEFYYYYLQAGLSPQHVPDYAWLKPGSNNSITHHPAGLSLLFLPMYLLATLFASLLQLPADGMSLPYQMGISLSAIVVLLSGLFWLSQWLMLRKLKDPVVATVLLLLFFGSTLFQYSIVEPAMSHVYSFAAISFFLLQVQRYVQDEKNNNLYLAASALGIILLLRPNNLLILLLLPFFFENVRAFLKLCGRLFKSRSFYLALGIVLLFILLQVLVWWRFEPVLFGNRYAAYGFNWRHPHLKELLFGFEAGLFVYCPILLLFLPGLIPSFKSQGFSATVLVLFLLLLFYFFSAYSAYTYFDGLGIRVLVDYYSLFALLGGQLLGALSLNKLATGLYTLPLLCVVLLNLVYTYQSKSGILLRAGMNYTKWRYVFLRTSASYQGILGGSADYPPYAPAQPQPFVSRQFNGGVFDYSGKEWGLELGVTPLGLYSNRLFMELEVERVEEKANSSKEALLCISVVDGQTRELKSYTQFRLNETPSESCCEARRYTYGCNLQSDFKPGDNLKLYIWNRALGAFRIQHFSMRLYNYSYSTLPI